METKTYTPLTYTAKQVTQVKNGMTCREFTNLYGDTQKNRNLYYKIKRMKPLSSFITPPTKETNKYRRLAGKIVDVPERIYLRGCLLLDLYDKKEVLLKGRHAQIQSCLRRDLIIKGTRRGYYQITKLGKDYLETILDNTRGWSHKYGGSYPREACWSAGDWSKMRMSVQELKKGFRPHNSQVEPLKPLPQVPKMSLWSKIRSIFPTISISFKGA